MTLETVAGKILKKLHLLKERTENEQGQKRDIHGWEVLEAIKACEKGNQVAAKANKK